MRSTRMYKVYTPLSCWSYGSANGIAMVNPAPTSIEAIYSRVTTTTRSWYWSAFCMGASPIGRSTIAVTRVEAPII